MIRGLFAGVAFTVSFSACASSVPSVDETSFSFSGAERGDPSTACPAPYDTSAPRPGANENFVAGDQSRTFELILPPARFRGPRPLLLAFHGTGETANSFIRRARLAEFA